MTHQFGVVPPNSTPPSPPANITEEEWVQTRDMTHRHEGIIQSHDDDIDTLKHGKTAVLAIVGFVTFVCGIVGTIIAFMALKPT